MTSEQWSAYVREYIAALYEFETKSAFRDILYKTLSDLIEDAFYAGWMASDGQSPFTLARKVLTQEPKQEQEPEPKPLPIPEKRKRGRPRKKQEDHKEG